MSPTPTPTKSRREIVRELAKLDALADVDGGAPTVAVDLDPDHADELRELNKTDDPDAEMSPELAAAIRQADLDCLDDETEADR